MDLIVWARDNCPVPVASMRRPFSEAVLAYDGVDERLGDDADDDNNDDFSKILWAETTIRLAQLGWTVEDFENKRWPVTARVNLGSI